METTVKIPIIAGYDPELDKIKAEDYFPEKLAKAKAYFEKYGLPDFNKLIEDEEKK